MLRCVSCLEIVAGTHVAHTAHAWRWVEGEEHLVKALGHYAPWPLGEKKEARRPPNRLVAVIDVCICIYER